MAQQHQETEAVEIKTPVAADYRNSLTLSAVAGGKEPSTPKLEDVEAGYGYPPLVKFLWWRVTKKQRILLIVGIVLLLLVVLILIAWFVIVKAVFQHYANSVTLSLNYLDITSIPDASTLGVEISLRAQHDISLHATTAATTATLAYAGSDFATFEFPALDIAKGEQDYNITIDGDLKLTDLDVFNQMAIGVVNTEQITVKASAELKAHGAGITYGGLDFKRELTVDGFNNFRSPAPTIDYIDFWGCTSEAYTMDINITIDSVAQMGLEGIGALNLSMYYEDAYLGYAVSLQPDLGLPRGESDQVFRAVVAADNTAVQSMVAGVIGASAQFYITGDNAYATEYTQFSTALQALNMSILYTDSLSKMKLNTSCNLLELLS